MKMQNLKPNLKEEKGTIWTFFFFLIFFVFTDLLIYLIFRGWSARENIFRVIFGLTFGHFVEISILK